MSELDREKLLEVMARAIAPRCWEVMDAELNRMLQKYKGQEVAYPSDQFQHKESMATARKALLALEASGVRLMPSTLTKEMCMACMYSDQAATGADRIDYHAVLHRRYTAQLSASPYKAKDAP